MQRERRPFSGVFHSIRCEEVQSRSTKLSSMRSAGNCFYVFPAPLLVSQRTMIDGEISSFHSATAIVIIVRRSSRRSVASFEIVLVPHFERKRPQWSSLEKLNKNKHVSRPMLSARRDRVLRKRSTIKIFTVTFVWAKTKRALSPSLFLARLARFGSRFFARAKQ